MDERAQSVFIILIGLVVGIFGIALYFLPAMIAYERKHSNRGIILLIDFLLGWTFIGWIGCLIWAHIDTDKSVITNTASPINNDNMDKYENLRKLMKLKESGAITEVEFEVEKAKILR